jgi:Flp pilus assembly protein TadG
VSTFLAVIALALLMAGGLALDGGRKVAALREATHIADNAARAAAQAVDLDTLRAGHGVRLIPDDAAAAANRYLASVGHTGTVTVDGDTATVTVTLTVQPRLLPTGAMTVTATETATAVTEDPT